MARRHHEEGREETAEREEARTQAGLSGDPGPLTIRAATPADADAIAAIQVASWRSAYRGFVHDSYRDNSRTITSGVVLHEVRHRLPLVRG